MPDFEVRRIEHREAKAFIELWHYSHKCPTGLNIFFGAFLDGELYAVADYGMGRNTDKGASLARRTGLPVRYQVITSEWLAKPPKNTNVEGLTPGLINCAELKRLCRQGERGTAQIPLTRFLSLCHRTLKRDHGIKYVISYSDPGELKAVPVKPGDILGPYYSQDKQWQITPPEPVAHPGTGTVKQAAGHIYRAANFQYLGETAPEMHTVASESSLRYAPGTVIHRSVAYKEMQRHRKRGEKLELAQVRKEYGQIPIKTPPRGRWFIALEPDDAKKLARRLLAGPV